MATPNNDLKTLTKRVVLKSIVAIVRRIIDLAVLRGGQVGGGHGVDELLSRGYESRIQI